MKQNSFGYASIIVCLLLPIVLLGLGLTTFSIIKTRHITEVQNNCRLQYHMYFSEIKRQLVAIEIFKNAAISLYHTQTALLPMIWMPPALKLYQLLLKLRKKLEQLQNLVIKMFNDFNTINSIKTFANIQRAVYGENKKVKYILEHNSLITYQNNPKLQIEKKMNILFPPYAPHPKIAERQLFKTMFKNVIYPKSWIHFLYITQLKENYVCAATISTQPNRKIKIIYDL